MAQHLYAHADGSESTNGWWDDPAAGNLIAPANIVSGDVLDLNGFDVTGSSSGVLQNTLQQYFEIVDTSVAGDGTVTLSEACYHYLRLTGSVTLTLEALFGGILFIEAGATVLGHNHLYGVIYVYGGGSLEITTETMLDVYATIINEGGEVSLTEGTRLKGSVIARSGVTVITPEFDFDLGVVLAESDATVTVTEATWGALVLLHEGAANNGTCATHALSEYRTAHYTGDLDGEIETLEATPKTLVNSAIIAAFRSPVIMGSM